MFKALCVLLVAMLLVCGCSGTGDCTSAETFCGPRPNNPESEYEDSEEGWLDWEECHDDYKAECLDE